MFWPFAAIGALVLFGLAMSGSRRHPSAALRPQLAPPPPRGRLASSTSTVLDSAAAEAEIERASAAIEDGTATPEQLDAAARAAELLVDTADAERFREQATTLRVMEKHRIPTEDAPDDEAPPATSELSAKARRLLDAPALLTFPGATKEQWKQFVTWAKQGNVDSDANGQLGLFLLSYRQLEDQELVRSSTKTGGEFVPPLTKEQFLGDPELQYKAFRAQMVTNATAIRKRYANDFGGQAQIENRPVTLSGLLGVSKYGLSTLEKWLRKPAERHGDTTQAFLETTGLF